MEFQEGIQQVITGFIITIFIIFHIKLSRRATALWFVGANSFVQATNGVRICRAHVDPKP
jgi:succinate dehydrogenase/fumarate reductase cytochrome b subunit